MKKEPRQYTKFAAALFECLKQFFTSHDKVDVRCVSGIEAGFFPWRF